MDELTKFILYVYGYNIKRAGEDRESIIYFNCMYVPFWAKAIVRLKLKVLF